MARTSVLAAAALAWMAAASTAHAAETIATGMIGSANAPGWPWYIGLKKGLFADAGIKLDIVYVPTASGLVQQLSAGSLDVVAEIGVVEPIHAVAKGAPVALVHVMGQVSPYALMAKPGVATIEDLKGKTICIGGLRNINRIYLDRIMRAAKLGEHDYDITVVGNTAGRFAALKSGAADATMIAPPFNFFAEDAGFRTLAMIRDFAPDLPFAGMDVSLAYAEKHQETLKHLIAAIDQAIAWFLDDRNRDEAIKILADEMHADPAIVARSYDLFRKIDYFARGDAISRKGLENLIREMRASGDLESDIAPEHIVLPSLVKLVE